MVTPNLDFIQRLGYISQNFKMVYSKDNFARERPSWIFKTRSANARSGTEEPSSAIGSSEKNSELHFKNSNLQWQTQQRMWDLKLLPDRYRRTRPRGLLSTINFTLAVMRHFLHNTIFQIWYKTKLITCDQGNFSALLLFSPDPRKENTIAEMCPFYSCPVSSMCEIGDFVSWIIIWNH